MGFGCQEGKRKWVTVWQVESGKWANVTRNFQRVVLKMRVHDSYLSVETCYQKTKKGKQNKTEPNSVHSLQENALC